MLAIGSQSINSNTTLVNVKSWQEVYVISVSPYSNTTLVNVKFNLQPYISDNVW